MTAPASRGATFRIFLVDGTPQGLRVVDRPGWTGSCLAFARSDYAAARERSEVDGRGVYVLVGPDPDGGRGQRAYVGETDALRKRLNTHQKKKDFWTHGYVFTTKDNSLNKAHVRYLETRLLEMAKAADNAVLENGTAPDTTWLGEPEVADMEAYLDNVLIIFPLVGVNVFDVAEPPVQPGSDATPASESVPDLFLKTPLTDATGHYGARGLLVHEGALARLEARRMKDGYRRLRDQLIAEGVLAPYGSDQLVMTKSFIFESPSAAAAVLSGGSKNGRIEWKDASGRTLKAIQEQSAS